MPRRGARLLYRRADLADVDTRCAPPPDEISIRPPHHAGTAEHSSAARAALPYADSELLDEGVSRETLHQLAAGSTVELSGPAGIPRSDAGIPRRGGTCRRDVGD